jgi:hypothetical protein
VLLQTALQKKNELGLKQFAADPDNF